MENEPLISVLMPVHNAEDYLREALDSLWLQTERDFEVIVVDDGSNDGSAEILAQAAEIDTRLRIFKIEHGGVTAALNTGLAKARGQLIARMDADDICEPDRFERQIASLENQPNTVAVGSAVTVIDEDGWTICPDYFPTDHNAILARMFQGRSAMSHPTVMIRAKPLRRVGGYDPSYMVAQDFDLWLRLTEVGELANLAQALLRHRVHPRSVGGRKRRSQQSAVIRALVKHGERTERPIDPPKQPKRKMITALQQRAAWARWAWRSGEAATARKHALAVLRRQPWHLELWAVLWRLRFIRHR